MAKGTSFLSSDYLLESEHRNRQLIERLINKLLFVKKNDID